jgi:hypothetical protein
MVDKKIFRALQMHSKVEDYLNLVEYKIGKAKDEIERYRLLGEKDALNEMLSNSRKTVLKQIRECHDDIKTLKEDRELFELNIVFQEGYIKGCKKVLDIQNDNEISEEFKILGYVQSEMIAELLYIIFEALGFVKDPILEKSLSIYLTSDISILNNYSIGEDIFTCIFLFEKLKKPKKLLLDLEHKDKINRLKEELKEEFQYNITNEDIFHDVKNLNEKWIKSHYIYISNILSLESIIRSFIRDLSL